jgi:hypothetical protein
MSVSDSSSWAATDGGRSWARQLAQAKVLAAGHGTIVAEFFEPGQPHAGVAAALVAALADPDRPHSVGMLT